MPCWPPGRQDQVIDVDGAKGDSPRRAAAVRFGLVDDTEARAASATLSSWVKGVCSPSALHTCQTAALRSAVVQRLFQQPEGLPSSRVRYWPSARRLQWRLAPGAGGLPGCRACRRDASGRDQGVARWRAGPDQSSDSGSCAATRRSLPELLNRASCSAQCSSGRSACWRPSS